MKRLSRFLFISMWIVCLPSFVFAQESNTLQQLIDETPEAGILRLDNITYDGNVLIDKPMTIIGKENTIIRGDGTGNVIQIESDQVVLDGLQVKHSGMSRSSKEEYSGVRVMANQVTLKNLIISDSFHGIYLNKTKDITIENNHITGHGAASLGNQGNGIHIVRSGDNIIEKNTIEQTRDGIFVEYSNNNEIKNNMISGTRYGLHYMYSNNNYFEANQFTRNVGGAAIMHSDHILLEGNSFSYNQGSRSFGLIIQASRDIEVKHNDFHLNQRGLYLEQSTNNRIEGNDFFRNQIGIELWTSSTAHVFVKNKFHRNNSDVLTVGGESINEWYENGVGNYWNKPMLDLNQDGIGDAPLEYTSSLNELIEENELAYLFLNSPAIQIYEKANELFSNQKVMAIDKYPMVTGKSRIPIGWLISIFIGVLAVLYFYKRGRCSCRIFGRKA